MRLFLTAFIQVFLVSANTFFISKMFWPGIAIAGYGISYFWTLNVKKIAISQEKQRHIYALGAMCGGVSGVLVSKIILLKINL